MRKSVQRHTSSFLRWQSMLMLLCILIVAVAVFFWKGRVDTAQPLPVPEVLPAEEEMSEAVGEAFVPRYRTTRRAQPRLVFEQIPISAQGYISILNYTLVKNAWDRGRFTSLTFVVRNPTGKTLAALVDIELFGVTENPQQPQLFVSTFTIDIPAGKQYVKRMPLSFPVKAYTHPIRMSLSVSDRQVFPKTVLDKDVRVVDVKKELKGKPIVIG